MHHTVLAARDFATKAHKGQVRKYTGEPYINHPAAVAELVEKAGCSVAAVCAAWLHDVVEDCGVDRVALYKQFGWEIATLVENLTDPERPGINRANRKRLDCERLAAALPDAQSVKCADLIDNTKTIAEHDPKFAKVYLREKRDLLNVMTRANPALRAAAFASLETAEAMLLERAA